RPERRLPDSPQPGDEYPRHCRRRSLDGPGPEPELDAADPRHGADRVPPERSGCPHESCGDGYQPVRAPSALLVDTREHARSDAALLAELWFQTLPQHVPAKR